jgi:hypothetical protein
VPPPAAPPAQHPPRRERHRALALVDPPACTAGSAAGLQLLKLTDRTNTGHGIRFVIRMRDLATMPAGPMRMSLVLGGTAADAANGACGLVTFTPDQCVGKPDPASPRSYQCRQ